MMRRAYLSGILAFRSKAEAAFGMKVSESSLVITKAFVSSNVNIPGSNNIPRPPGVANSTINVQNKQYEGLFTSGATTTLTPPDRFPRCRPNFKDYVSSYKHLSLFGIIKALGIIRLCHVQFLTSNAVGILSTMSNIIGEYLTYETVLRWTMYNHFCAGSNEKEIRGTLRRLNGLGVGSILDYAAEADVPCPLKNSTEVFQEPPSRSMSELLCIIDIPYKADDEEIHNNNMKNYILCIAHASLNIPRNGAGFAAVKLSGLCDPRLLSRLSAILVNLRKVWYELAGHRDFQIEECRCILYNNKYENIRFIDLETFLKNVKFIAPKITIDEAKAIFSLLDDENTGRIDYLNYIKVVTIALNNSNDPSVALLHPLAQAMSQLTPQEMVLFASLQKRLHTLVDVAVQLNVRIMMDAEQSFYQPGIDHIVRILQREYNKSFPYVYNTYQCYLTYMPYRIDNDIARAKKENWVWAGKIVRGAYMVQERATSQEYGYVSPIHKTAEDTHNCYNTCAKRILDEVVSDSNTAVLFGTHNLESLEMITDIILKNDIMGPNVSFAQLLGMADHLTMPLSKAGFYTFKYVPYGPVKETIHYLSRRSQENSTLLTEGSFEVTALRKALRQRFNFFGLLRDQ
eukprot:Tbor_TRINITY_DN5575_c4_g2::TRINITY_DN5575_c4_g2_i2::g.13942::m.13942/K00318/PRODH; proline dehydrogenase